MIKFAKKLLLTCIISLQVLNPITTLYANTLTLEYDGAKHTYNKPPITLNIDGKTIGTPDMPPVIIGERTLVPTREVFEPMGASVEWKPEEKKVIINHGETFMVLEVDSNEVFLDGKVIRTDVAPKIINNKQMVPLRFISEALGYKVDWDADTSKIEIKGTTTKPDVKPGIKPDVKPGADISVSKHITKAKQVQVDSSRGMSTTYSINFSEPIETYETFSETDKIVFDIDKTQNLLPASAVIDDKDNNYVQSVRTSQFTETTTRVVFDLKAGTNSNVEVSNDRKKILIHMDPVTIKNVQSGNNGSEAYISLPGISKSQVEVSTLENPNRLVIDLPMCTLDNRHSISNVKGGNILDVRLDESSSRTRIVLDLIIAGEYNVVNIKGGVKIQIDEEKQLHTKNMDYNTSGNKEVVTIRKPAGLAVNAISVKDDYRNKTITLTLPGNYNSHFGQELLNIESANIENVLVKTNGNTQIVIKEKKVRAMNIVDTGDSFKLEFMSPRDKYDKIVLLDLGHGGRDGGASANGLVEKKLNFDQGMPLFKLLEQNPDIKVYITREDDSYPANSYRANLANEVGADIFISIHNNSAGRITTANGTEVLYSPKSAKGKQVADILQKNMVRELGMNNRGTKSRTNLLVLNQTKMPAVIVETGFVTNPGDVAKLSSPAFNEKVGRVLYDSILEVFNKISFR